MSEEKLDATIVLGHAIITAVNAAKALKKHDKRGKQLLEALLRVKANAWPIIQEEAEKLSKEDEEFNSFSNSKSDWIEGRR
tara:strand:+ start:583 stop:825 length:243 start_codon:yes stop_codon:yes gene_type:complete